MREGSRRHLRGVASALAAFGTAASLCLAAPAGAQQLPGSPGIDYYPSWMHQDSPWVPGSDNDYDPLPGERFQSGDQEFQAWRADQIRRYGPDYYKRPGYQDDYDRWQETRGAGVGGGRVTRDRDIGGAEPTLGR